MRKMIFPVFLPILVIILGMMHQEVPSRHTVCKSGIIEYKFSGIQEGIGILQFDDFGKKSNFYRDIVEDGKHRAETVMTLGTEYYVFETGNTDGIKMSGHPFASLPENGPDNIILRFYGISGLIRSGDESYFGKKCEIWSGDDCRVLMWKGILMHLEVNNYGRILRQEATAVRTDILIDPEVFDIPDHINFIENPGNRIW